MPWPWVDGDVINAAEANKFVPDGLAGVAFTPAVTAVTTNPALGTGASVKGRYYRMGKVAWVAYRINFGTSNVSAGSGAYRISSPIAFAQPFIDNRLRCGWGRLYDASVGISRLISAYPVAANSWEMVVDAMAGPVDHDSPWIWAASDWILFSGMYEVA